MQPKNYGVNLVERMKANPLITGFIVFGAIVIILLVVTLINLLRDNEFGTEIRIDNLTSEYQNLPKIRQDLIFNNLYETIAFNSPDGMEIPKSGAIVREGSAKYDYNETTKVYYGDFIVDIPNIEQSYRIQFEWSPINNNQSLGGYPVVITCLKKEFQIYPNFVCKDIVEMNAFWENAFQLDYTFGASTSSIVRKTISNYLINEIEADGYTIRIDESTLKNDKNQPILTYLFKISLNNNYNFEVIVRMDEMYGNEYIAIYLTGNGTSQGFILTNNKNLVASLSEWLRNISKNEQLSIKEEVLEK